MPHAMLVVLVPEAGDPFNSQDSRARKSWLWRAPSSRVRQHGRKFASRQPDQWTNGWCWSRRTVWRKGVHEIFSHNMSQLSIFIVKFSYVDIHTYIYIYMYIYIYVYMYTCIYIYDIWLYTGLTCVSRQGASIAEVWLAYIRVSAAKNLNSQREWCEQKL